MSKSTTTAKAASAAAALAAAAVAAGTAGALPVAAADAAGDAAMNAAALAQATVDRQAGDLPAMTADEACALVRRRVVLSAPGAQSRVIEQAITPDEVLAFKDCGTHVVVVTVDGQKFSSADVA